MLPSVTKIDLQTFTDGGRILNLSGKEKGEDARQYFNVDEMDAADTEVVVLVPKELDGISSSFFLGLFSKSVQACGSPDKFFRRYKFDASSSILRQVKNGVKHSLMDRTPFSPE